jgi:hypothetical protein
MPRKSAKQHRFLEAIAHGWKPDRKKGPSKRVAQEFVDADAAADEGAAHLEAAIAKRTAKVKRQSHH